MLPQNGELLSTDFLVMMRAADANDDVWKELAQAGHLDFESEEARQKLQLAILAFFDFATAFPSVAHEWLFVVLEALGAPKWLINYISGLYSTNNTYYLTSSGKTFLFAILSGVLQGCPMSATLFLFAIDPFLVHFEQSLSRKYEGAIRVCADDIGAALADYRALKALERVFACAKRFANLTLKPAKCNVIPLNQIAPDSDFSFEKENALISKWLHEVIPHWSHFQLVPTAKYLGFYLGPGAGKMMWKAPTAKWERRSRDIAFSHMSASFSPLVYNSQSITVLGYIAQLFAPPKSLLQKERQILNHIMHTPTNTFEARSFFNLGVIGLKPFHSIEAYCRAASFRAAAKTLVGWQEAYQHLSMLAETHLTFRDKARCLCAPACWDSPPFVKHLSDAYYGHGSFSKLSSVCSVLRNQTVSLQGGCKSKPVGVQGIAYRAFLQTNVAYSFSSLLTRRCSVLGISFSEFIFSDQDFNNAFAAASEAGPGVSVLWLKTVCNGWCTSKRMHENQILDCIFGCPDKVDTLAHYLACPILLAKIDETFPGWVDRNIVLRLNYAKPSPQKAVIISAMFQTYHMLKIGMRHTVDAALQNRRFSEVMRITSLSLSNVAELFKALFDQYPNRIGVSHVQGIINSSAVALPSSDVPAQPAQVLSSDAHNWEDL